MTLSALRQAEPAEIARRVSPSWENLGCHIICYQADEKKTSITNRTDDPDDIRTALIRSARQSNTVTFQTQLGQSGMAVPVSALGQNLGSIACLVPQHLAPHAASLLAIFSDQINLSRQSHEHHLEITDMSKQLTQSYEELSLLYRLTEEIKITQTPKAHFSSLSAHLADIVNVECLILFAKSQNGLDDQIFIAGDNFTTQSRCETVARYFMKTIPPHASSPTILPDISVHPTLVETFGQDDISLIVAPLPAANETAGVLIAVNKKHGESFTSADAKLLHSVAKQIAGFLENRSLVHDLNGLLIGLLTSLVSAIDAKDPYTSGHSRRVALVAQRIAETLGLKEEEIAKVYLAGLLHDTGKIGIEDSLLTKPGKLNNEEFDRIREHPVIGARIISGISQLREIIPGVLYHHERIDGSGYPEGLTEHQIPLLGSIVGLADSFDAITSSRTYREALSFPHAIREIRQSGYASFRRDVVDALTALPLDVLKRQMAQVHTHTQPHIPPLTWLNTA